MEDVEFSKLVRWPGVEKLTLVSGGRTLQGGSEIFSSRGMRELVIDMKTRYPGRMFFLIRLRFWEVQRPWRWRNWLIM